MKYGTAKRRTLFRSFNGQSYKRWNRALEALVCDGRVIQVGATGVDAATGKQLWQMPFFAQKQERAIGSPSVAGEFLIVNCAFTGDPKHVVVLKPNKESAPCRRRGCLEKTVPHIPSPIIVGQRAYLWSDQGIVTCAKLATGEAVSSERVDGEFLGSPVCTGDKLFAVDKGGKVFTLAAGLWRLKKSSTRCETSTTS